MEVIAQQVSGASSWLRILRGLFGARGHEPGIGDFKKKLIEAKVKLQETISKIDEALNKLKHRDAQLFTSAVKALASGDEIKASIYAGEVAEIRKIMKTLTTVRYAIEQVSLRLETMETVEDIGISIAPLIPVLRNIRDQLVTLIPDVTSNLDEALQSMQEVVSVTSSMPEKVIIPHTTREAENILQEARRYAEKETSIMTGLPELPSVPQMRNLVDKINAKIMEKLREEEPKQPVSVPMIPRRPSFEEVKKGVLDYIRSHRGFLDVADCAKKLGVEPSTIRKALEELIKEGKIRVIK